MIWTGTNRSIKNYKSKILKTMIEDLNIPAHEAKIVLDC